MATNHTPSLSARRRVAWSLLGLAVAAAALGLLGTDAACGALGTNLNLYSSMDDTTPYLHAAHWQDATGNGYDGQGYNVPAVSHFSRLTAVDFSGDITSRMTLHNGFDTLLDPGKEDFSVSLWYYETATDSFGYLLTNGNSVSSGNAGFCLASSNGNPLIRMNDVGQSTDTKLTVRDEFLGDISGSGWHHMVAVFDRTGTVSGTANNVQLYIDNAPVASAVLPYPLGSPSDYNILSPSNGIYLGGQDGSTSHDFEGYMDDVALYRGALSATDVSTLYNATNLTASTITTPGITPLVIHNFETNLARSETLGAVPDSGGTNAPGAMKELRQVTDPVRGEVLEVNGLLNTSESVKYGDVLDPGSTSYTASLWIKLADSGNNQMIASKGTNQSTSAEGWSFFFTRTDENGGTLSVRANYDGTTDGRLSLSKSISFNEWHHVAMVIDQENGQFRAYLDGLGSGATGNENEWTVGYGNTFTPGTDFDSAEELGFAFHNSNNYPTLGRFDDLAIWSRALTDAEILGLANGTLTLPPQDVPGDANNDGKVDAADAAILVDHWLDREIDGGASVGDFNGDRVVDDLDASILAANWADTGGGAAAVPEPSTLVLLAGAVLLAAWRRRKR